MCPLPAYLSKAAGFRMVSEPLILVVGSELYTEPDRRPPELRRHWLQVELLGRMDGLERVALVTTPVLNPAFLTRCYCLIGQGVVVSRHGDSYLEPTGRVFDFQLRRALPVGPRDRRCGARARRPLAPRRGGPLALGVLARARGLPLPHAAGARDATDLAPHHAPQHRGEGGVPVRDGRAIYHVLRVWVRDHAAAGAAAPPRPRRAAAAQRLGAAAGAPPRLRLRRTADAAAQLPRALLYPLELQAPGQPLLP